VNEGEAIIQRACVGRKHKEEAIERAQDDISRVPFPTSEVVHRACGGAARTSGVGA
jgi:hypothetical protein